MAIRTLCPACEEHVAMNHSYTLGTKIRCPNCYADLVVKQLDPLELDWDEDGSDDDWDDDRDDGSDDDNWKT